MELNCEKMDNLIWALIFYIAGSVIRTVYGFLAKVATAPTSELQFDVKYWAQWHDSNYALNVNW